jgi:hypothetical protein
MKKIYIVFMLSFSILISGCAIGFSRGGSGKVPPGQAKKAAGTQSAKPFAPGQQKKR